MQRPVQYLHLLVLDVEAGIREQREVTGMVKMHMREDDVLDLFSVDSDCLQSFTW